MSADRVSLPSVNSSGAAKLGVPKLCGKQGVGGTAEGSIAGSGPVRWVMATGTRLELHGQHYARQRLPRTHVALSPEAQPNVTCKCTHLSVHMRLVLAQHAAQTKVGQLQAGKQTADRQLGLGRGPHHRRWPGWSACCAMQHYSPPAPCSQSHVGRCVRS